MEAVPENELIRLFHCSIQKKYILEHMFLGKQVGVTCLNPTLQFTEEGVGVLISHGKEECAADLLKIALFRDEESQQFVVVEENDIHLYHEYMALHTNHVVHIPMRGSAGMEQHISLFARPHDSCHVWWHLPSMWGQLHFSGTAQAWYHKHWKRWSTNLAKKHDLLIPHLRRALPTKQAAEESPQEFIQLPERVLEVFSMSTKALLALLPQWSTEKSQHRDNKNVKPHTWKLFLESFVRRWVNLPPGTCICLSCTKASPLRRSSKVVETCEVMWEVEENGDMTLKNEEAVHTDLVRHLHLQCAGRSSTVIDLLLACVEASEGTALTQLVTILN